MDSLPAVVGFENLRNLKSQEADLIADDKPPPERLSRIPRVDLGNGTTPGKPLEAGIEI